MRQFFVLAIVGWALGCGPTAVERASKLPLLTALPDFGDAYQVPKRLPRLVAPEIIVSLARCMVHLLDRHTGFSEVYAAGVGRKLRAIGILTPVGHFTTGHDVDDRRWYIPRRTIPAYFGGYPFLRITARDARGRHVYGLHGPVRGKVLRGYVTGGCIRLSGPDMVRLFYLVRVHPRTPVTIGLEPERDAAE